MPHEITDVRSQDLAVINVGDEFEVSDWAKKFDVTSEQIRAVVSAVGNQATRVRSYLRARR
jgi:hypothetical protein